MKRRDVGKTVFLAVGVIWLHRHRTRRPALRAVHRLQQSTLRFITTTTTSVTTMSTAVIDNSAAAATTDNAGSSAPPAPAPAPAAAAGGGYNLAAVAQAAGLTQASEPKDIIAKALQLRDSKLLQLLPQEMQTPEVMQDMMQMMMHQMAEQDSVLEQTHQQNALLKEAAVNGYVDSFTVTATDIPGVDVKEVAPHVRQAMKQYMDRVPLHTPEGQHTVKVLQACSAGVAKKVVDLEARNKQLVERMAELEAMAKRDGTRATLKRAVEQAFATVPDVSGRSGGGANDGLTSPWASSANGRSTAAAAAAANDGLTSPWATTKTATVAASAAAAAAAESSAKKQRNDASSSSSAAAAAAGDAATWRSKADALMQQRAAHQPTLRPDLGHHVPTPSTPLSYRMFNTDRDAYLRLAGHSAEKPAVGGGLSPLVTEVMLEAKRHGKTGKDLGNDLPLRTQ